MGDIYSGFCFVQLSIYNLLFFYVKIYRDTCTCVIQSNKTEGDVYSSAERPTHRPARLARQMRNNTTDPDSVRVPRSK